MRAGARRKTPFVVAGAIVLVAGAAVAAWFGGVFHNSSLARFDGVWQGAYACPASGSSSEVNRSATVVVRNGSMLFYTGLPGQPGSFTIVGAVRPDDTIELTGPGIDRSGANYQFGMAGKFTADQFAVTALPPTRPCQLKLARQPGADIDAVQRSIDADLAKRNTDADQLRLNAEAERKKADADAAKAQADANAALAKAEADAAKAKADADVARARADADAAAAAAKAKADADAAIAAATKAKADADRRLAGNTSVATAPKTPMARINRFDGVWRGNFACQAGGSDNRGPSDVAKLVRIKDGQMTVESGGTQGEPRTYRSVGTIGDDDTIDLRGPGTTSKGTPYQFHMVGKFGGNGFTGDTILAGRACRLTLARDK